MSIVANTTDAANGEGAVSMRQMPLTVGETFAVYTIVRLHGAAFTC